jgi:hypothetical protein
MKVPTQIDRVDVASRKVSHRANPQSQMNCMKQMIMVAGNATVINRIISKRRFRRIIVYRSKNWCSIRHKMVCRLEATMTIMAVKVCWMISICVVTQSHAMKSSWINQSKLISFSRTSQWSRAKSSSIRRIRRKLTTSSECLLLRVKRCRVSQWDQFGTRFVVLCDHRLSIVGRVFFAGMRIWWLRVISRTSSFKKIKRWIKIFRANQAKCL